MSWSSPHPWFPQWRRLAFAPAVLFSVAGSPGQAPAPPTSVTSSATWRPLRADASGTVAEPLADFRLQSTVTVAGTRAAIRIGEEELAFGGLEPGRPHQVELVCAMEPDRPGAKAWLSVDGRLVHDGREVVLPAPPGLLTSSGDEADQLFRLDRDFTVSCRFTTGGNGTLFARCAPDGAKWAPGAKALFVRGGRLVYDIGWVGALGSKPRVDDGEPHTATVVSDGGSITLYLDGEMVGMKDGFSAPDPEGHVFKTGRAAPDFAGTLEGQVHGLRFYRRALGASEVKRLVDTPGSANTPDFDWTAQAPGDSARESLGGGLAVILSTTPTTEFQNTRAQALGATRHAEIIREWGEASLGRGKQAYSQFCIACHGTPDSPGTLPTARAFHQGPFLNGHDPFRLFQTLSKGYGQMVPQPFLSDRDKYDIIHFVREEFLKPHNPGDYTAVTESYLAALPLAHPSAADQDDRAGQELPPYRRMDFGPSLFGTYQVGPGNIAKKGLAVRLDPGPGGIARGRAWMVYDHDTMRVAAAYTGTGLPAGPNFIDWRSIAFDGSHGTHPAIVGQTSFTSPVGPGIADPENGSWDDPRPLDRDGNPYGPLPGRWVQYRGVYHYADKTILEYTVGETRVLELPGLIDHGATPVFTRSLDIGKAAHELTFRLAPNGDTTAMTTGPDGVVVVDEGGFHVLHIPPGATPCTLTTFVSRADRETLETVAQVVFDDLSRFTKGGPARWETEQPIVTTGEVFHDEAPWAVDELTAPDDNPWGSWMRFGGFDFDPADPGRALIGTWSGDIWSVTGIGAPPPAQLTWRRVASGLFQPLGLKFQDGTAYVTCRDQLAELHDLNGDGEFDYVRAFNSDHQVTEHFHEFAMGLQTDAEGNFYYAKSARHAKPALVPHHGTLLRVAADGSRTDIIASGFRAANGVCLNPDGSFLVTDQEGHWTPKNRINVVRTGGFYGNMLAYDTPEDESDEAMEPPLCWLTNSFDRSPAEPLWVPSDAAWGGLNGTLINLSYGYGQLFVVPHEQVTLPDGKLVWQGGACPIPLPRLPSGLIRGRFSPADGQLYACGMFAWAGNQTAPGGFYRIRHTGGAPITLPSSLSAREQALTLTFTDPLEPSRASDPDSYQATTWSLHRSSNYGSKHLGEHDLPITNATLSPDRRSVTLTIPDLTRCDSLRIRFELAGPTGSPVTNELHATLHHIP